MRLATVEIAQRLNNMIWRVVFVSKETARLYTCIACHKHICARFYFWDSTSNNGTHLSSSVNVYPVRFNKLHLFDRKLRRR